jgi:hypothetical protein
MSVKFNANAQAHRAPPNRLNIIPPYQLYTADIRMETSTRTRMMELSIERLLKTNNAADVKVSTLMGMNTTMLAVLAAILTSHEISTLWLGALAALAALGLLLGLFFLSLSSFPRTSRPTKSVVFFGAITAVDSATFTERIKTITDDEYIEDLADQCYRTAVIATQKFRWIQRAQRAWYTSIIPWLLTVYLLYKS